MISFAALLVAMLAVLAIVAIAPRLARPHLLPACRAAAIAITTAAYLITITDLLR